MKNFIILSALLFLLNLSGYSQTKIGIKAGGNLATVDRDYSFGSTYKHRIGFHLGAVAERDIGQKTFFRSELFYSRKGSKVYHGPSNASSINDSDYLNLPVLVGYRLIPNLSIYLGPEVDYTLGNPKNSNASENIKYPKDHKNFDFGVDAGILYNLTSALALDLRYTYGLVKMGNVKSTLDNDPIYDGQNRVAQLGVNYYFKK